MFVEGHIETIRLPASLLLCSGLDIGFAHATTKE